MGGSRKPRRRRAASGSLTYTARPPRTADATSGRRRDTALGCGCMVAVVLGIVVPAIGSTLGGTGLWRWTRDSFPGGGYGFAVVVGALIPVVLAVGAMALGTLKRSAGKARSAVRGGIAALCFAALMPLGTACAEMMGPSRKHHDRTGGWAYEHYAWIWAVALLSALVMAGLIVTALVLRARSRTTQHGPAETV